MNRTARNARDTLARRSALAYEPFMPAPAAVANIEIKMSRSIKFHTQSCPNKNEARSTNMCTTISKVSHKMKIWFAKLKWPRTADSSVRTPLSAQRNVSPVLMSASIAIAMQLAIVMSMLSLVKMRLVAKRAKRELVSGTPRNLLKLCCKRRYIRQQQPCCGPSHNARAISSLEGSEIALPSANPSCSHGCADLRRMVNSCRGSCHC
mmetsp:Transcript_3069/g.8921  ORF Transcript_3069/g.8921 Transcript_3069/m.8921 type:complete len:207 (-) Transcript_3069:295-915(-)